MTQKMSPYKREYFDRLSALHQACLEQFQAATDVDGQRAATQRFLDEYKMPDWRLTKGQDKRLDAIVLEWETRATELGIPPPCLASTPR